MLGSPRKEFEWQRLDEMPRAPAEAGENTKNAAYCVKNQKAAEYYLKAADFMRSNPGFDKEMIEWALDKAKHLKA